MPRKARIIALPTVKAVTKCFGGKRKVAERFLAILFRAGFHIAPNRGRQLPKRSPKDAA